MHVEPVTPAILATVFTWWGARDDGFLAHGILPPCGRCVMAEGKPLAAAWLYQPWGCSVGMIDWLVTRPGLSPATARRACRLLFAELEAAAREGGATMIFATTTRPGMEREACRVGFHVAATGCTHLVKHL